MSRLRHPPNALVAILVSVMALAALAACGRTGREREPSTALAVEVFSDTSRAVRLRIDPPLAPRVWMKSVSIAPPAPLVAPLPAAEPASPPPDTTAHSELAVDPGLKAPILITAARLVLPTRERNARSSAVELDVRVSEAGEVTDARWAGGSADSSLVAAASACALGMRFHPALLDGRPVSVWCRQRFEFPAR